MPDSIASEADKQDNSILTFGRSEKKARGANEGKQNGRFQNSQQRYSDMELSRNFEETDKKSGKQFYSEI